MSLKTKLSAYTFGAMFLLNVGWAAVNRAQAEPENPCGAGCYGTCPSGTCYICFPNPFDQNPALGACISR